MTDNLINPKDLRVKVFVEGGHAFETDERGELVDIEQDIHNMVWCVLCHDSPCIHCEPDWASQKCEATEPTLPGLELPITPL